MALSQHRPTRPIEGRAPASGSPSRPAAPAPCLDNAVAESFFATLKISLAGSGRYRTRATARSAIFRWIAYYNHRRLHSTLGYRPPSNGNSNTTPPAPPASPRPHNPGDPPKGEVQIVGWAVGTSLATDLPLAALKMALWRRRSRDLTGLVHHSDRGSTPACATPAGSTSIASPPRSTRSATATTTRSCSRPSACTRPS